MKRASPLRASLLNKIVEDWYTHVLYKFYRFCRVKQASLLLKKQIFLHINEAKATPSQVSVAEI